MIFLIGWILLGVIMADFLSGAFHWWEDRLLTTDGFLFGEIIAKPNQLHHDKPKAMTLNSFWSRNLVVMVPSAICLGVSGYFLGLGWWSFGFFVLAFSNEIHNNTHRRPGKFVRILQDTGLLQSTAHHAGHHRGQHAERYCVVTNFLNPILDGIRFWRVLEYIVSRFGVQIQHEGT